MEVPSVVNQLSQNKLSYTTVTNNLKLRDLIQEFLSYPTYPKKFKSIPFIVSKAEG